MKKSFWNMIAVYFGGVVAGLFLSILINLPLKMLFADWNNKLLYFALDILITVICMFVFSYKNGYKSNKFNLKNTVLSLLAVLGVVMALGIIIGNAVYITGPTDFLISYFFEPTRSGIHHFKEALKFALNWRYSMLASACAFVFVYSPIIILAEYFGVKKHIKDLNNLKS